jgi:hypothetical protein
MKVFRKGLIFLAIKHSYPNKYHAEFVSHFVKRWYLHNTLQTYYAHNWDKDALLSES